MFNLKPTLEPIGFKFYYNIGILLDIPTGEFYKGKNNEYILNGGLSSITLITGLANAFKSTIMHYMVLTAMSRFKPSTAMTYDTEINIDLTRLKMMVDNIEEFKGQDVIEDNVWNITDKDKYFGNEWFEELKKYLNEKSKGLSSIQVESPFLDRELKPIKMPIPTFTEIDSITLFNTKKTTEMSEDNELGDAAGNTLFMKEGLEKKRIAMYMPTMAQKVNNYFLLTAHMGRKINMNTMVPLEKKLQTLKNDDELKGVPKDIYYITTNMWQCLTGKPLINSSSDRVAMYPKDSNEQSENDVDLFEVTMINLRSKTGAISGHSFTIIVSQYQGVLPSLTEFHHIKTESYYGLEGGNKNYVSVFLPEVKLMRTTIRSKLDSDPLLRRAINITSELLQFNNKFRIKYPHLVCEPKQLYEDLKLLGYDWNILLRTRSWWTYDNEKHEIPFLSIMDLLRMRLPKDHKDKYHPYWLDEDKKTINTFKK